MNEQVEQPAVAEVHGEILVRRRHRRQSRRENWLRRIWHRRRWEIIGLLALLFGLFLVAGPLARWRTPAVSAGPAGEPVDLLALYVGKIVSAVTTIMDRAAEVFWSFMLRSNWAVKAGWALLAFAIILIPLRARWWLLNESPWLRMQCPRCGSTKIHRVHRRAWERVAGKIVPMRRYRCSVCRWRGMRIDRTGHASAAAAPDSSEN